MCERAIRIILADADADSRSRLAGILADCGYQVISEVSDGFDAVESCRAQHPDLMILDIDLPLLDGLSAARYIHREELADAVMLITARSDRESVEQAKEFGVNGYLVKPVDPKALIPSIELAVIRSREIRSLRNSIAEVTDQLESRTVIDKAKGLIMAERGMKDAEAYEFLKKISIAKNLPLRQVAEIILVKTEG